MTTDHDIPAAGEGNRAYDPRLNEETRGNAEYWRRRCLRAMRELDALRATPTVSPEREAEDFIQVAVDQSPEPLRRLGRYLRDVLDEDQFKAAYGMLLAVAAYGPEGRVRNKAWEERVAWLAANRVARPSRG